MPSGSSSSSSSLAFLSSQLEETRANQMKERSKRTLELMKTAVEWKSWEELRTLTKAFQVYLEEIRETDQRRKRDLETGISRVWAARHQLAKADRHKDEAMAQAELLRTENDGLRHQLEFDARQFVALLQSCAHLERQLAELRQRHGEQEADKISSGVTRSGVEPQDRGEAPCDPSSPSSCFSAKALVDLSSRSHSKGVSARGGQEALSSKKIDHQSCDNAEVQKGLVHRAGGTNLQTSTEQGKAVSQEIGAQGSIVKTPAERQATEAVADMRAKEAPDEEGLEGHSPFGTTQLSETSTVVAMSPSDAWNSPSRDARRLEALRVLSALADLKKKLEICSAMRVSQSREKYQDASVSTTDGTGLASPGDAQAEDAEDVSAVETGTSRSSVCHSPAGTLGESLRGRGNGKLVLGPRVSFASQSRCSEEQKESDQESPSSPFLRPSVLAAEEASRLAAMKTQAEASFELSRDEECTEVEPTDAHSMSQLTAGWGPRIPAVTFGGAAMQAGDTLTLVQANPSAPRVSEQNGTLRQAVPHAATSRTCRSLAGSVANISPSSDGRRTLGTESKQGLIALPVPPASPSKPSPEQLGSHTRASRQPRKAGGPLGSVERQPDASYVAPIKLVQELNNLKVPSAKSHSHSGPKEAHQSAGSKAYCREKPMTREMNNSPPRQRQSGHGEQKSTKASL